jgi:hypothetical protein
MCVLSASSVMISAIDCHLNVTPWINTTGRSPLPPSA